MKVIPAITALSLMVLSSVSAAKVYKCDENGSVQYQDSPCAQTQVAQPLNFSGDYDQRGFLKKYFKRPEFLAYKANCSGNQCQCGSESFTLEGNESVRLTTSMLSLVDAYQSYEPKLKQYYVDQQEGLTPDRGELEALSCVMQYHQNQVNRLYDRVLKVNEQPTVDADTLLRQQIDRRCGTQPKISGLVEDADAKLWFACRDEVVSHFAPPKTRPKAKIKVDTTLLNLGIEALANP